MLTIGNTTETQFTCKVIYLPDNGLVRVAAGTRIVSFNQQTFQFSSQLEIVTLQPKSGSTQLVEFCAFNKNSSVDLSEGWQLCGVLNSNSIEQLGGDRFESNSSFNCMVFCRVIEE